MYTVIPVVGVSVEIASVVTFPVCTKQRDQIEIILFIIHALPAVLASVVKFST